MEIFEKKEGNSLTLAISGRLDTVTAPNLDAKLEELASDVKELQYDLAECEYVSSAGLRMVIKGHKLMSARQGSFAVMNVKPEVKEVFDLTGLTDTVVIK